MPNVRAKLPAEAGAVSLVRDDAPCAADQAYSACRSGSGLNEVLGRTVAGAKTGLRLVQPGKGGATASGDDAAARRAR